MSHAPGVQIGPYSVLGELGRGGMGVVHRARSPRGEDVAIKILSQREPEKLVRFERERRLLGQFKVSDGFVPLLDAGDSPRGPYLVMPLIPGGTLEARLEQGAFGVDETLALGVALCRALARAHERGIVHRDLKPSNVLFAADGQPLVADLGLAKHFSDAAPGATQTVSVSRKGELRGTAGYMAPEQMSDARSVGPQADVFSLGAILYECLAGRPAFVGDTVVQVLMAVAEGRVQTPRRWRPDVPPWLEAVILRALAKEPAARFPDASAMLQALRAAKGRRRRARNVMAVLAGATLVALGGAVWSRAGSSSPRAPVPPPGVARVTTATPAPERSPPPPPPLAEPPLDRWALYQRAMRRSEQGDLEGAIKDCTKIIELDPNDEMGWVHRGFMKSLQGDDKGALPDLTMAVGLAPRDPNARINRGRVRSRLGQRDGAIEDLKAFLELAPRDDPQAPDVRREIAILEGSR